MATFMDMFVITNGPAGTSYYPCCEGYSYAVFSFDLAQKLATLSYIYFKQHRYVMFFAPDFESIDSRIPKWGNSCSW